jgi:hypothetical protein
MRFVVRASNTRKSALLATNHSHHYGAKLKVIRRAGETDFEVFGGRNRLSF